MMTFILGDDGRIHEGSVKMSGYLVECETTSGRRKLSDREVAILDPSRMCPRCFEEVADSDEDEDHRSHSGL